MNEVLENVCLNSNKRSMRKAFRSMIGFVRRVQVGSLSWCVVCLFSPDPKSFALQRKGVLL